jgi:hypothetical protein
VTNRENPIGNYYRVSRNTTEYNILTKLIPILAYKIEF